MITIKDKIISQLIALIILPFYRNQVLVDIAKRMINKRLLEKKLIKNKTYPIIIKVKT